MPFDLLATVEGIVDLMRPRAQEKSIGLSAAFEHGMPRWFEGDPHRFRQVLLNLVGNAIKFTSTGEVVIRVTSEERQSKPALVTIAVSDTGIGIPVDQRAHVFDKFQQADDSTTRMYGGTGLGLAIARELTALMGGTISLSSSEVGVGSTFTVTVPLARALSPEIAPRTSDTKPGVELSVGPQNEAAPPAVRRILVAEDDITNQIVIEGMLEMYGFQVKIADSGLSAVELFREHGCDLILMDCQMPRLDGFQATKRIREMEGTQRHTPIIALTANAMAEDRQRCLDAGMDDYLTKPIGMDTLLALLTRWNCGPPKRLT
jgi:CheY-like chemotaxis protein